MKTALSRSGNPRMSSKMARRPSSANTMYRSPSPRSCSKSARAARDRVGGYVGARPRHRAGSKVLSSRPTPVLIAPHLRQLLIRIFIRAVDRQVTGGTFGLVEVHRSGIAVKNECADGWNLQLPNHGCNGSWCLYGLSQGQAGQLPVAMLAEGLAHWENAGEST
jgi:hypothetical protein